MSQAEKVAAQAISSPDWYRLEADADRVVKQLGGLRELSFYLKNPNPYIRRIALLRVGTLVPKDAPDILTKILEDNLETEENKRIAAWALNRTVKRHGIQWFLNHPFLQLYTGLEDMKIFGDIRVVAQDNEIRLDVTDSIADLPDINDPTFLKTQMDEQDFNVDFSLAEWLKESSADILRETGKSLKTAGARFFKSVLPSIGKTLLKGSAFLVIRLPKSIAEKIRAGRLKRAERTNQRKADKKATAALPQTTTDIASPQGIIPPNDTVIASPQPGAGAAATRTVIPSNTAVLPSRADILAMQARLAAGDRRSHKGGGFRSYGARPSEWKVKEMFQVVFYPIRLVRRHLLFTAFVLLAFYAMLTFTRFGHGFLQELNPHVSGANDRFVVSARTWFIHAFDIDQHYEDDISSEEIVVASEPVSEKVAEFSAPVVESNYRVTATKGLNLREGTGMDTEKIVFMAPKTVVAWNGESAKGSDGSDWMKVRTQDGKTGWAAAKWLEAIPEE